MKIVKRKFKESKCNSMYIKKATKNLLSKFDAMDEKLNDILKTNAIKNKSNELKRT